GVDTLVDGAHAPGVCELALDQLNAAYFTGNLHKWVCAPKGAAFLWAREDKQADLLPAVVSHGLNRPRAGFTEFQDRFDWAGTLDPSPWFCVGDAITWMGALLPGGWPELREANHQLVLNARRNLASALKVEPPCPESMLGSMATLPLPPEFQSRPSGGKIDDEQLRLYDQFGIEVPFVRLPSSTPARWFRISAQIYNTPEDYRYLAHALKKSES
ncbi:MAG: aminotransferase, partial [Chthoniobacteraceae bacterium]